MRRFFPIIFFLLLIACTPQTPTAVVEIDRERINVYADSFSLDQFAALADCAARSPFGLVVRVADINAANIILTVNPQQKPDAVAYQLGEVQFLPVVSRQNPLELSFADLQAIYSGKIYNWSQLGWDDAPIQVWAYNSGAGVNGILLGQGSLSSLAYQAQTPAAMRSAIQKDMYAIGFLPAEALEPNDNIRSLALDMAFSLPVLALLPKDDASALALLECLE